MIIFNNITCKCTNNIPSIMNYLTKDKIHGNNIDDNDLEAVKKKDDTNREIISEKTISGDVKKNNILRNKLISTMKNHTSYKLLCSTFVLFGFALYLKTSYNVGKRNRNMIITLRLISLGRCLVVSYDLRAFKCT